MARERRLFSEEFKREAVKLVGQPGASKASIARDLGIGANLLGGGAETPTWMQKAQTCLRRYRPKNMSACGGSW